jgi:DNA helicase-2/ATP-dependent DNA helicase PcrA
VTLAPELLREYPKLDDSKKDVIGTTEGPVLVVAGPGSGKTFSLVLRTLNLLLLEKAEPNEVILCTFTQKAAFELRDRVSAAAAKIGYARDLTDLKDETIKRWCARITDRTKQQWRFARVNQSSFDAKKPATLAMLSWKAKLNLR